MRWNDDIYSKPATTDRSVSAGRGYSNNDPIGNTDDKEITTAFQRAGETIANSHYIDFKYYSPFLNNI